MTTDKRDAEICRLYEAGVIGPEIARRFGVTRSRIYQILHKRGVDVKPNGWNLFPGSGRRPRQ